MNIHTCLGRGYNVNYGSNVVLKVNTLFSLKLQRNKDTAFIVLTKSSFFLFVDLIIEHTLHILLPVEKGCEFFHKV